jgi:hypothetical protein
MNLQRLDRGGGGAFRNAADNDVPLLLASSSRKITIIKKTLVIPHHDWPNCDLTQLEWTKTMRRSGCYQPYLKPAKSKIIMKAMLKWRLTQSADLFEIIHLEKVRQRQTRREMYGAST